MAVVKFKNKAARLTVEELNDLIDLGAEDIRLSVPVDTELAEACLRRNQPGTTNRRISTRKVDLISRQLRDGSWMQTGEPIIFADNGLLNNGQHRLAAVIATGIPMRVDIRFGVAREAFVATDSHAQRSSAAALQIMGISNQTTIAGIARCVVGYERGLPGSMYGSMPNFDITNAVTRWPELLTSYQYIVKCPPLVRVSAVGAIAFFAQRTAAPSRVKDFFDVVREGTGAADNPPHRYREYLLSRRGNNSGTSDRVRVLANGILAWNAYLGDKPIKRRLKWTHGSPEFPTVRGLKL